MPGFSLDFVYLLISLVLAACGSNDTPVVLPTLTIPTLTPTYPPAKIIPSATFLSTSSPSPIPNPTATPSPMPDFFSQAYPPGENDFRIPLTIRHVTDQQATLFFELRNPEPGWLVYRNSDSPVQEKIALSPGETRHIITLEGLLQNTAYEAKVMLGSSENSLQEPYFSGEEWGTIHFHTTSNDWPFRVGVLGDASFGDQATEQLVELMAGLDLDFVLHTGDVVYETDSADVSSSYVYKFFKPFSPLLHQGPVYSVLGNHDYDYAVRWQGQPFYDYVFPPFTDPNFIYPENRRANQYYAIPVNDIQFLMLDSHVFAGAEGREEQDAWLDERLADPRFRITIPVFHTAPYSSSLVHPDDGLPIRYSWNWRFEQARVPLVLSGHFHHYERLIANGITYLVSGGGSSVLYAQGESLPESQIYARQTHFVLLEFYANYIELKTIALDGHIIDQAMIALE